MARVSVHIVTYNSTQTIATCLQSLHAQIDADFDVHIIDNGSKDGTVQQILALGFDVICNPVNRGYAAAHNQLLERTSSTYVLTLNPDVQLAPNYIAALTDTLDHDACLGSASGCLLRVDRLSDEPMYIDSAGLLMHRSRHQGLRAEKIPLSKRPTQPIPIFGPDGAAAFYRRAMLEDIRLFGEVFDTDFFLQKEDIDICWRAQLRGWQSVYVPAAIAKHIRTFRPGQRERVSPDLRFYGIRNRYLLIMKNDIAAHFWRDLWAIALYDLLIVGYVLLRERSSSHAFLSAFSLIKMMMKKRRAIQSRRRVDWHDMQRWFEPLG